MTYITLQAGLVVFRRLGVRRYKYMSENSGVREYMFYSIYHGTRGEEVRRERLINIFMSVFVNVYTKELSFERL